MAISVRSTLSEKERVFTIALDRCGADGVEGILYHGENRTGWRFSCLLELSGIVEQVLCQIRYPAQVMEKRRFRQAWAQGGTSAGPVCTEMADWRDGTAATCILRVKQRHNASWQGSLTDKKSGKRFVFCSFLELVNCLESCAGHGTGGRQGGHRQMACRYLSMALLSPKFGDVRVNELIPGTVACQVLRNGKKSTFVFKLMFFENDTCQGILCWRERHCQQSFRSFLELLQLIGGAAADVEGWDGMEADPAV